MPTIPRYQREISIPGTAGQVMMSPEAAAAPYAALSKAGEQTAKLGEGLMDVAAKLERQKEDAELIEAGAKINDEYLTFKNGYKETSKGIDATGSMEKANEFTRSIIDKYTREGASQRYGNLVRQHIAAQDHIIKNDLAGYEAGEIKKYSAQVRTLDLESSKRMAQAGDYGTATINYQNTLDAQKANGTLTGKEHQMETQSGKSHIAEAYIRSREPVEAKTVFEVLKDDLLADVREKMGPGIKAAAAQRSGLDIGTAVFKENPKGSVMEMTDKVRKMKLDADTERSAVSQVQELVAEQHANEQRRQNEVLGTFSAYLIPKVKATGGYILPSHLTGPAWEAFKSANPKGALEVQITAGRNANALSIQNNTERMTALQAQKTQQDTNADTILRGGDFPTRNLRADYVSGTIGISQFQTLTKIQEQMDPLKHDAVKAALDKIESGTALSKALGGVFNKNEIAMWRLKYTALVKDFAVKNINKPDFERKLSDLMEKNILSDMVTSWFALDSTDRQRKFEEAQKAAAITGQQAKGKTLDSLTAASILQEAKGDKNRARKIARQRGYTF